MLKAEGSYILPDNVPANEFLNLEGDKISTSRNWAVWLHEYLQDFPGKQDVLRYVLCANAPETKDNDFTWKDFQARNNNELLAIYGNFVNRTLVLCQKYFDSKVPSVDVLSPEDEILITEMATFPGRISGSLDHYRFREALNELMNLARLGNKYLTEQEPWKKFKEDPIRVGTVLNLCMQICANLSILGEPFLPFTSQKINSLIEKKTMKWSEAGRADLLSSGHQLNQPEFLFERIEDDTILAQVAKLHQSKADNETKSAVEVAPAKNIISYDDFTKMDIRIGTILAAEKVPKTKKLLKVTINTGVDTRTIVSGIAEFYEPEDLVGKQACFLINLEPREIKGNISNGMVLMAEDANGKLSIVAPTTAGFNNGSTVK